MCAELFTLEKTIREFEQCGVEYLHIDIMDGSFVPNYTLGTDYCKRLRKLTDIPLDIHLMIDRPEDKVQWFDIQPGEYVSIHYEATSHVQRTLQRIKDCGGKPMLGLNPATPICALENVLDDIDAVLIMTVNPGYSGQNLIPATLQKIADTRKMLDGAGRRDIEIEVDGNVSFEATPKMRAAGADIFVAGTSSIFTPAMTMPEAIAKFREIAE